MSKTSLDKSKIKFLLLEGVHPSAVDVLKAAGYTSIEYITSSLPEDQLKEKIADAHFIGIRSRTQLTEEVFDCAKKLVAVGCFCIGTNQVDLNAARERGIAVFNAPYSNTRSVAGSKALPTPSKSVAKSWVSSVMVRSVLSCRYWLKAWACRCSSTTP